MCQEDCINVGQYWKIYKPLFKYDKMDGRRNFLKTAFATCSLLASSKLLTACTPIKKMTSDEEETLKTFATPND